MSKAAKQSIFILIFLLLASLGFAGYTLFEKQKVGEEKAMVEGQLKDSQEREKKNVVKITELEKDLQYAEKKINDVEGQLTEEKQRSQAKEEEVEERVNSLNARIAEISEDRDRWKRKLEGIDKDLEDIERERDNLKQERDDLLVKLKNVPPPQIIYKEKEPESYIQPKEETQEYMSNSTMMDEPSIVSRPREDPSLVDEEYWASILKEKASLEVELDKLKEELSQKSIEIVELKKDNSDLGSQLDTLRHDKEQLGHQIQDKEEMVNRISLELARAKNDKKFVSSRIEDLDNENQKLRQEIRQLTSSRSALEKSIVQMSQEKSKMEKKLGQTETIIQSKIDEIWEIKDSIDQTFKTSQLKPSANNEVELPPIVVNSSGQATNFSTGITHAGFNGTVVSINEENNFIIVDIGEQQGIKLGDTLSVYRDSKYIARIEVIQVRTDISAADVKDQWSKVRVGDVVR